jgi:predicted short-subunit dehydrogenase-like oxidoreductase (DUF2520 family)
LKSINKIVILGTGNLATHLTTALSKINSIAIVQLYNHRPSPSAKKISKELGIPIVYDISKIILDADFYIIAVKDQYLANFSKQLSRIQIKGIVAHTSGSQSIDVIKKLFHNTAVVYPLQSFYPNAKIKWIETPILIESNTETNLDKVKSVFSKLSKTIKDVDSETRLKIHLAAVFACNFTNALYVSSFEIMEKKLDKQSIDLLMPIMRQSFEKLNDMHPIEAQTGPASRNDKNVISKHRNLLKSNKELLAVYNILTELIQHQQKIK